MRDATRNWKDNRQETRCDGAPFDEGANVMVLAAEGSETFDLGPQETAVPIVALAEAKRDDTIDGLELLAKLTP